MSGGHFNYNQYEIGQIADEIEELIHGNHSKDMDDWHQVKGRHYSKATISSFNEGMRLLRIAQIYAHEIDWLLSGDTGEDRFHERLDQRLNAISTIPNGD